MAERIQLFKPWMGSEEHEALREPLETGWIGSGPKVLEFERQFAAYIGVKHAVALNSGTAALHLAMLVAGVDGGEVLTTPMTFVSSNHCILHAAAEPVFCDIEPDTLNLAVEGLEESITERTRAILAVHYGGHPCDMNPILEIAARHGLQVIEDAAQGCGGTYRDQRLGSLGDIGCFSFDSRKNLSTGDGGMLTTNDDIVAERVQRLKWMGISRGTWERFSTDRPSWDYDVTELGFKYLMNDIAASLGLVQLAKLERGNGLRRALLERYRAAFAEVEGVELLAARNYGQSACYCAVIQVDERDGVHDVLSDHGIESAVHFLPTHLIPIYQKYNRRPLPVAEAAWLRILTIPLFPELTAEQQDRVVDVVRRAVSSAGTSHSRAVGG
jgi:perosamine synthetase